MSMRMLGAVAIALLMLAGMRLAFAEGRCPPGQYPVGGGGALGCAPIPGDVEDNSPRPLGRWIKTWGAISISESAGDTGISVGHRTKAAAWDEAKARCATYGAKDCAKNFAFKNTCMALANPEKGSGGRISYSTAATPEAASERVLKYCADGGGGQCVIVYSGCTEPVFDRF